VITLVLGGASSGKSAVAEKLVARHAKPITYVATGVVTDDEMAQRITIHQKRRPPSWGLVEATGFDLLPALERIEGSVLLESLGTWVASFLPDFSVTIGDALCDVLLERVGDTVVVTEEVGLGVHPATELGRHFREDLGRVNAAVAEIADRALLVIAGRVLALDELE
jgi:adenosylcobinamide kinase/adenosylcobinamide-phosphate guanylyltransferase